MSVDEWILWEDLLNGGTTAIDKRQKTIDTTLGNFSTAMVDDPAYQSGATINGVIAPILASKSSTLECDVKALPGTSIHIGDMVNCFDEDWVVTELFYDKLGIANATMWLCNNTFVFQNKSPTIIRKRCVVDDGSYGKRNNGQIAYAMSNTYKVFISIDDETKKLFVDKRIGFGEIYSSGLEKILEVYKIVGIDLKSKNFGEGSHLMVLTMQRDVYNSSTDDISLNLCDVYTEEDVRPSGGSGTVSIDGPAKMRIGTTRTFVATPSDTLYEFIPVWSIDPISAAGTEVSGNSISITVPIDEDLIGSEITITVDDDGGHYSTVDKKVMVITVG